MQFTEVVKKQKHKENYSCESTAEVTKTVLIRLYSI